MTGSDSHSTEAARPPSDASALYAQLLENLRLVESKLDAAYSDIESQREGLEDREREFERRFRQIAVRESRTRLQRKRISEELRANRAELGGATGDSAAAAETESLQRANDDLQRELRLQRDLADEAMREASIMRERMAEARPNDDMIRQLRDELQRLMIERDEAREALEAAANGEPDEQLLEDQRRLTDELSRLEAENADLASQVDELRDEIDQQRSAPAASHEPEPEPVAGGGFDWETQKKLLLENLDEPTTSRLQPEVNGLERVTQVLESGKVADESELQDLRDQVNLLIAAIASTSDGNTGGIDYVSALEEEREKLDSLQQQWHDKLRESELEISVERAKLARERVRLEEEIREMEAEKNRINRPPPTENTEPTSRNRWLARLGLSDDKES